jgi:hypothetical protein
VYSDNKKCRSFVSQLFAAADLPRSDWLRKAAVQIVTYDRLLMAQGV